MAFFSLFVGHFIIIYHNRHNNSPPPLTYGYHRQATGNSPKLSLWHLLHWWPFAQMNNAWQTFVRVFLFFHLKSKNIKKHLMNKEWYEKRDTPQDLSIVTTKLVWFFYPLPKIKTRSRKEKSISILHQVFNTHKVIIYQELTVYHIIFRKHDCSNRSKLISIGNK